MKYINKFSTNAEYQAFTEGGGYVTPNICYVTESKGLKFKPKEKSAPVLITFTVDGVQYQAEEGMTWEEWRYSEYNTDNLIVLDSNISFVYKNNQSTQFILNTNDYVWVLKNDSIIDNKSYIFIAPGAGY